MEAGTRWARGFAACLAALALAAWTGPAVAGEMGSMKMEGMSGGSAHGQGMMKMGDKVFAGKIGPWHAEARLADMKAQMEKAKASGMKMEGMMKNTHHLSVHLLDPKTKKMLDVTEGKGTVTIIGPDKKEETANFMVMQGHFGADVNLPKPGKYVFRVQIESGGKTGSARFSHTVK